MSEVEVVQPDTVGPRLARGRERLGFTQEQVADRLRLDAAKIVAMESGDYAVIGAAVFVRGFLRRYAELVGESPAEIDALYAQRAHATTAPDLAKIPVHPIEVGAHRPALGAWPALIAALVLAGAGGLWWALSAGSRHASSGSGTDQVSQVLHVGGSDAAQGPGVVTAGTAGATAGGTAMPATSGAGANLPAAAAGPGTETGAAAPAGTVAGDDRLANAPRRRLDLRFSGECWAEIYDARGARLFFGFGHAGSTEELSGVPPFRLVLGNVTAVTMALQGDAVELPAAAPGARLRLSLNGNGTVADVH
jgi:cytoskeleton protein RodZ